MKWFLLALLLVGGCSSAPQTPKPAPPPDVYQCRATVRRIEYHGDQEKGGGWYVIVLESPEGALWTIKVLYTYPPVWEGLQGEMQYEVDNRSRAEYKNLVVLRRLK